MKNKTLKESLIKNEKIYEMGIFLQYVLLGALIILSICTIFINELLLLARIVLGLLLFVMGYNNYKFFNKTGLMLVYFIAGILIVVMGLVKI